MVVRPAISRAASKKKRKPASRLSFGVRAEDDEEGGAADDGAGPDLKTPKKKTGGSGLKKAISLKDLAMRSRDEEDDRPRYSKEYLEELQSSTPNTPRPASNSDAPSAEDEMNLDMSELEGAMIVDDASQAAAPTTTATAPRILTETEIREKKERRARLAHETSDFISLSDDEEPSKKKDESRLVREDENIYEGFEDFVEDDDVALGRKAEREARRRKREEMASLIKEAEGNSDDESDESDAERRVAFEAAQSRAGMDGLQRPAKGPQEAPKPRITPLVGMEQCIQGLQGTLSSMAAQLEAKSRKVAELRREREEIREREAEVQRLVDEAGEKYRAAVAGSGGAAQALEGGESPDVRMLSKETMELAAERGLESLGTPTTKGRDVDDDDGDLAV